jgi:predicted nucleotidyltransferase
MEKELEKIANELKKEKFVEAIILFGSFAKGKATPISDIDVCVIDNQKFPKKVRRKAYAYSSEKVNISLFSELPLYIKHEVLKGKPMFIRHKNFFRKIKEITTLEYLHTRWLWETHFEIRKKLGKWSIGIR